MRKVFQQNATERDPTLPNNERAYDEHPVPRLEIKTTQNTRGVLVLMGGIRIVLERASVRNLCL